MTGTRTEISQMKADDYDEVAALWNATEGVGLDDHTDTREGVTDYLARNPGRCHRAL